MKGIPFLGLGLLVLNLIAGPVFGGTEKANYTYYGAGAGGASVSVGNALVGGYAGYSLATGYDNTFLGHYSGYQTTTGSANTFIGAASGFSNSIGNQNVFVGERTGYANTRGDSNTFVGDHAGYANDYGNKNVFIGQQAGYFNNYGHYNAFLGFEAGKGNIGGCYNTFMGYQSGLVNTSGGQNIFVGYHAGYANTEGHYNTFLGPDAGNSNIDGSENVFLGEKTGYANITGGRNTYLGSYAGHDNTEGRRNVFVGYKAGYDETGSDKLYIANSDTSTPLVYGDFSRKDLIVNGKLAVCTLPGVGALTLTNYWEDKVIKSGALYVPAYKNFDNPFALIQGTTKEGENLLSIGGGTYTCTTATRVTLSTAEKPTDIALARISIVGNGYVGFGRPLPDYPIHMASGARVTAGGVWTNASSREYKDRIQSLSAAEALAALNELNPVKYVYKADKTEKHVGFIAEEVPELLATKDRKGLSAMDIVAVLTKALQEQQKVNLEQQKLNRELLDKIGRLEEKLKQSNAPASF